jgi:homoserine O-acetyltransferase
LVFIKRRMTDDVEVLTDKPTAPRHLAQGDVGVVSAHDFVHATPFTFKSGQVIPGFTLRYETYGSLLRQPQRDAR